MRAYKIDVVKQQVYEVEHEGGLNSLYELIGCDCVCIGERILALRSQREPDVIYVDDEGLLKPAAGYFQLAPGRSVLAGNGLLVGTTADGNDAPPVTPLRWLQEQVRFFKPGEIVPPEPVHDVIMMDENKPLDQAWDEAVEKARENARKRNIRPVPEEDEPDDAA